MRHAGHRPAERLVDVDLTGRIGQMIVAPDDVRDAHVVVVDHDGQHIHRGSVRSHEDAVVEILVGPGDAALYLVVEHRLPVERGAKAQHGLDARAGPRSDRGPATGRRSGAVASRGAPPRASPRVLRASHSNGRPRPASSICCATCFVALGALGLVDDVAVPIEAEPAQPVEDGVDGGRRRALAVRILDAQQHGAAVPPRVEPVEQGRPGPSDVEETRRRRREARDHGRWHGDSQILER